MKTARGCTIIKMDVESDEWKKKIEELNKELDKKEGDNRHKLVSDVLYKPGFVAH